MKGNYFYDHFLSSFWILAMHFHYMESKSVDIFLLCLMEDVKYLRVRTTWGWVIITKTYKSIPLYSPTQDLVSNRVSYWCKAWLKKSLCSLMDHSVLFFFSLLSSLKTPIVMNKASGGLSFYMSEKDIMTNPQHSSIHSLQHISLPACVQPNTAFWHN